MRGTVLATLLNQKVWVAFIQFASVCAKALYSSTLTLGQEPPVSYFTVSSAGSVPGLVSFTRLVYILYGTM